MRLPCTAWGCHRPSSARGWGDLSVVDFNHDAKHFQSWPPEHFELQVRGFAKSGSCAHACLCMSTSALPARMLTTCVWVQVEWKKLQTGALSSHLGGTPWELLEGTFRSALVRESRRPLLRLSAELGSQTPLFACKQAACMHVPVQQVQRAGETGTG